MSTKTFNIAFCFSILCFLVQLFIGRFRGSCSWFQLLALAHFYNHSSYIWCFQTNMWTAYFVRVEMCRHPGQKARRAPKGRAGPGQEGLCGRTGVVGCDRAVTSNNTRPSTQPLLAWPRSHISTLTKYAVHVSL